MKAKGQKTAEKLEFFILEKRFRKGLVTKEDLERRIQASINAMHSRDRKFFRRIHARNQRLIQEIRAENQNMKEDFQNKMMFLNENLVHDFRGAFSDRTEWLKDKAHAHEEEIVRIKNFLRLR